MPAGISSSYSLWPEQARPRRTGALAIVSGGFVAGVVVAMAGNWVLLNASLPTVGSEVVGTAAAIGTSTRSRDEDSGAPQACDAKRAPYGVDRCPPVPPVGTMARGERDNAASIRARERPRAAARARLPIIGSMPAVAERDGTDGRSGAPAVAAADEARVAPVGSESGRVNRPSPAPKLERTQTTTLEGAGNETERPTQPLSTVEAATARETASKEGLSEKAKPTTEGSQGSTKIMRTQLRTAAERVRRAERRTARRTPASDRIRRMPQSPFDYVAQQSYGYAQPRYSHAAQQSYEYQQPRYSYSAQQSYAYRQPRYGYDEQPQSLRLFPF
jgi:hypothetical protein